MYNRVGRALFVVGRQFRRKLCENTSTGAIGCAASAAIHCAPNNYVFRRSYCHNSSDVSGVSDESDESDDDTPTLLSKDEEGKAKLKEFLSTPENERIYKIIEMEIEVMRQNSERVPDTLRPHHWAEIVQLGSRSKRRRYLTFLFGLEKKKENEKRAKEEKREAHEALVASGLKETPLYSLSSNSLFLRFYEQTMNRMFNGRLMNQMLFGQKVVLDCGYEKYMTLREIQNCAKQLQLVFATNRNHIDPFDLYFCNADSQGQLMKILHRSIPTLYDDDFPINIKAESYLDVFDKKDLVYLTPHTSHEMHEFDHDTIYIVGAFVDKSTHQPVSLAKAKKEGLRMAKFPLERYLRWGANSGKNLTLNQVVDILLDLRKHGSWDIALNNVPRRKLYEATAYAMERKVRRSFDVATVLNETDETPAPVRDIKPKAGLRFNADPDYRPNRDFKYRSSYERNVKPNSQRDSKRDSNELFEADTKRDFTMKSRAKFKNNWKN